MTLAPDAGRELHRGEADSTRRRMHEHALATPHLGDPHQADVRGQIVDRDRGREVERELVRHRNDVRRRHFDVLGVTAEREVRQIPTDAVADRVTRRTSIPDAAGAHRSAKFTPTNSLRMTTVSAAAVGIARSATREPPARRAA